MREAGNIPSLVRGALLPDPMSLLILATPLAYSLPSSEEGRSYTIYILMETTVVKVSISLWYKKLIHIL